MHPRLVALYLAISTGIGAQGTSVGSIRLEPGQATLLTVCELLENVDRYAGKVVAVVGRLSSAPFDGAWLSENGCGGKVPRSDPHWPFAIFLGCSEDRPPNPGEGKLDINAETLRTKLDRLRKTTQLDYYMPLIAPRPGEAPQKPQPQKETWAVAFGRIKRSPTGQKGWYGAVRAQAQLCSSPDSKLVEVEEPDRPHADMTRRTGQ